MSPCCENRLGVWGILPIVVGIASCLTLIILESINKLNIKQTPRNIGRDFTYMEFIIIANVEANHAWCIYLNFRFIWARICWWRNAKSQPVQISFMRFESVALLVTSMQEVGDVSPITNMRLRVQCGVETWRYTMVVSWVSGNNYMTRNRQPLTLPQRLTVNERDTQLYIAWIEVSFDIYSNISSNV